MPKKKDIDSKVEDFAEEVSMLGKRMERRIDKHHHAHVEVSCCPSTGSFWPFISSVASIVVLAIVIWALGFVNGHISSDFLGSFRTFLLSNMGTFFIASLFFSYASYFSKKRPKAYEAISPIVIATSVAFALWVVGSIVMLTNVLIGIPVLSTVLYYMTTAGQWIFGIMLFVGYVALIIKHMVGYQNRGEKPVKKERVQPEKYKRLYRSGKEKILGGVCGGIAEYLGIDPVLIRLLWVAGTFAFGFGVLLYIIAWIIIPRNPNHKW